MEIGKRHWNWEPPKMYGGKAILDVFSFILIKGVYGIRRFYKLIVMGSWFQIVGAATEKARLPIFSLALGTKVFGNDIYIYIYISL